MLAILLIGLAGYLALSILWSLYWILYVLFSSKYNGGSGDLAMIILPYIWPWFVKAEYTEWKNRK